jgi:outer membrane protein assembly factor BamA
LDLDQLSPKLQQNLLKQIPSLKNGQFTQADLDSVIRYLMTQELYDSAAVQLELKNGKENYRILLGKTKRISSIKVSGNDAFSESELKQILGMSERATFDQEGLIEGGERIRNVYKDRGFHNAVVDLEFFNSSPTEIEVRIKLNEGVLSKVTNVSINTPNTRLKERLSYLLNKHKKDPLTEVEKWMRDNRYRVGGTTYIDFAREFGWQ